MTIACRGRVPALLGLCLLAGCGGDERVPPAEPSWTGESRWRLDEDLRLGEAEAGGPAQFGLVTALVTDTQGAIYVLDSMSQDIRVFRADGTFSHRIGRAGSGPGEFNDAVAMAFSGDTLWVSDLGAGRYSAFLRDGTFLRSAPHQRMVAGAWPTRFLADGRYLEWTFERPDLGTNADAPRLVFRPTALTPGDDSAESFPPIEATQRVASIGGALRPAVFFSPRVTLDIDGSGSIWFAHGDRYELVRRSLEGDTLFVLTLPGEAAPLDDADRAYARRRVERTPALAADYLRALPATRPIVGRVMTDGAGYVYVFADVAGSPAGTVVDVLQNDGRYLGRLTLPEAVSLNPSTALVAYATHDHLFLAVAGQDGTPFVSRLRIHRPGS